MAFVTVAAEYWESIEDALDAWADSLELLVYDDEAVVFDDLTGVLFDKVEPRLLDAVIVQRYKHWHMMEAGKADRRSQ
jgi:hypothetical protein